MSEHVVEDTHLSRAWARTLLSVMDRRSDELTPLLVSITSFPDGRPAEELEFRAALDAFLASYRKPMPTTGESAGTIFPYKSWQRQGRPAREDFFRWYLDERLPRLHARNRKNAYGTYFERMIGFSDDPPCNQLETILSQWAKRARSGASRPRRSALQAVVVDPTRDLTGQALRGFPCLQQVSFSYDDDGGLGVTAYYPTQYIVDRAYGNYLGLAHLGAFMAHEMRLRLARLDCFIAHPVLGTPSAGALRDIIARAQELAATEDD